MQNKISGCSGPPYLTAFGRRSFIQVGFLGGLGLSLADVFATRAQAGEVKPATGRATHQILTGYLPSPTIIHPSLGAVVAHTFGPMNNMPPYVGLPNVPVQGGTGYLSSKFGAFELGSDPSQKNFKVRDISLP